MEATANNKMAVMPIPKLMLNMGIPMILSMAIQAIYNIVDSAFVGNMAENSQEALNALTLAFPIQSLIVALAIGTGVGVNVMISKNLGMGNREGAARAAGNSIFLGFVIYLVILLFGIFGSRAYLSTQSSNETVIDMGVTYMTICCVLSFGMVFYSMFEKMLQATGRALYSTIGQITGAVINIIFDPLFIYGIGPFPKLGVAGAAYATVLGQICSAILLLVFYQKMVREFDHSFKYVKPNGGVIRGIYAIGIAAILAQALTAVMVYVLNIIFKYDALVQIAYGLFYKVQLFVFFLAFGLRDAITPIVSFANGMGDKKRERAGIRWGLIYTLILMAAGTILTEVFPNAFAHMFNTGASTDYFISAMRIISISFAFGGVNIAIQGVFQALEAGMESLVVSLLRQIILILPLAAIFTSMVKSGTATVSLTWSAFIITEVITCAVAVILLLALMKKRDRK